MKFFIIIFLILYSINIFSADAIVIVLQAPLLKSESYDSTILQYVRKGERVFVPDNVLKARIVPEFIETYDRAGNTAYIPTKYLKFITNDEREYSQSINYDGYDPTDYRIEEPIPKTYPFNDYNYLKTSVALSLGNNVKSPYDYNKPIQRQEFNTEKGIRFLITKRVDKDSSDRFYFGMIFGISSVTNYYEFKDTSSTTENRSILRAGPFLSYDTFKSNNLRITLGTGFTYNYHRALISLRDKNQGTEERFFKTFSFSPLISSYFQFENIIPKADIVAGCDLNFYMTRTMKATAPPEVTQWPSDQIDEPAKPQASLYLGVQLKY